jgi:hypothetical protein
MQGLHTFTPEAFPILDHASGSIDVLVPAEECLTAIRMLTVLFVCIGVNFLTRIEHVLVECKEAVLAFSIRICEINIETLIINHGPLTLRKALIAVGESRATCGTHRENLGGPILKKYVKREALLESIAEIVSIRIRLASREWWCQMVMPIDRIWHTKTTIRIPTAIFGLVASNMKSPEPGHLWLHTVDRYVCMC